ncbi:hypothetical protein N781_17165 [Pontibacillus halophilus JSM 076056 = DSM 19796]|uniref:YqcI/YcgG family protein n=1 Tax=Pontibacillus halophilus JSM 076056 = DSM 19796 TaxID=1385510 RepID=A0A0A5GGU0_9BACI|nr:YqcI/YcgG family protein [Pontibacillus halophilus]KGX92451.1 hypothetical protein N781_17165 [Pontibacillus halophilus JSM 076056 = DSM 19796]
MSRLFDRTALEETLLELEPWKQDAYTKLGDMIADEENTYPCVPARVAFLSNELRYGFIDSPTRERAPMQLACLLKQYGQISRQTGKYASIAIVSEITDTTLSIEQYEHMFWDLLSRTTAFDETEWPTEIPKDPAYNKWEFCFNGEPYFAFCATPVHALRKSRHFPYLLLAFQPRFVFEEINDSTRLGRNLKKQIRKRLAAYDEIPTHPALKWYGDEQNLEWKQYFLRDDDSTPSTCPFLHHTKEWEKPKT